MRRFALIRILVPCLLFMLIGVASSGPTYEHTALQAGDQCDWNGSGGGGRGVRPVYLRCSRGTVSWRYPRGALRVVLSPPVGRADIGNSTRGSVQVRACTKVSGLARVYLEGNGKLRPVYSPTDGKHEASHRCFHAKKGLAAFYIEAEVPATAVRRDTKLQYDLEVRYLEKREGPHKFLGEDEDDCRPCSLEELAKAYCQSDLVARGTISAVQRQPGLEAAELLVGITKTLRRIEENEIYPQGYDDIFDPVERKRVHVRVPTACDARHGQGEFVIMAKRRLGDLVLVCAPRLETWAKAVRELETAPCVLKS